MRERERERYLWYVVDIKKQTCIDNWNFSITNAKLIGFKRDKKRIYIYIYLFIYLFKICRERGKGINDT